METTKSDIVVNSLSTLKGRAAHTANRIINAMNKDTEPSMCHAFGALTDGAKAIVLQAGHYSNIYIRGNANGMDATAAAQELETKAAANVSRKLRHLDHAAVAFLAEYISRQRNEVAKETTPATAEIEDSTNTESTMTTTTAPAYEETHAARCLHIYLNNTSHIYEYCTQPAIDLIANEGATIESPEVKQCIKNALHYAMHDVRKYDHLTPTPADVEHVKRNYIAYIIECAQSETANA